MFINPGFQSPFCGQVLSYNASMEKRMDLKNFLEATFYENF